VDPAREGHASAALLVASSVLNNQPGVKHPDHVPDRLEAGAKNEEMFCKLARLLGGKSCKEVAEYCRSVEPWSWRMVKH
jgi:hypothetical protein